MTWSAYLEKHDPNPYVGSPPAATLEAIGP